MKEILNNFKGMKIVKSQKNKGFIERAIEAIYFLFIKFYRKFIIRIVFLKYKNWKLILISEWNRYTNLEKYKLEK